MTQEEFDRALAQKRQREESISSAFASAEGSEMEPLLREFLCCKYLLRPEELVTDDLITLGEISTAKVAGLQRDGLKLQEKSAGCTTASSGVIKKVLLAMAVGKLLGVKLDPDAVAAAKNIPQLAELLVKTRGKENT